MDELEKGLKESLGKLGILQGDILYVSSDIKSLLFILNTEYGIKDKTSRNAAIDRLVNVFQEVLGKNGTLLFPVFSWEWCRGNGFDVRYTKGEVGTLSNWMLEHRKDFVRTRHPMYSFMVWGKDALLLTQMDNQDAWSHSSPFYYFQTHGAKQLLWNIEAYQGLTFGHYVEQEAGVPYRHPKYFFGEYTDADGATETRMYSMYVRDVDVEVECGICNDWLLENGVAKQEKWLENRLTVVNLEESYPIIIKDMRENNGRNTLSFATGGLDWTKTRTVPFEVKGI